MKETREEALAISKGGQDVFNKIESSPKPVIAAINGVALGGGLELALSCHHRIASNNKTVKLGLPEVMLGLLPGAGGTQRLPKLIGLDKALPMCLTGSQVNAKKAKKTKLVDHVVEPIGPGLVSNEEYFEQVCMQVAMSLLSISVLIITLRFEDVAFIPANVHSFKLYSI